MPWKLSAGGGGGRAKEKKKLWVQGLCVAHARYQGQANKCTQQSTTYSSINSSLGITSVQVLVSNLQGSRQMRFSPNKCSFPHIAM